MRKVTLFDIDLICQAFRCMNKAKVLVLPDYTLEAWNKVKQYCLKHSN